MHLMTPFLATEHVAELRREAEHQHLVVLAQSARRRRTAPIRRGLALGLVAISRASAGAVRRLDACVADDLGRSLAPTDGV
jgi:hypothetical protein